MPEFLYSAKSEAPVYADITGKKIINRILLGTYVSLTGEEGDYYSVKTAGPDGWMKKDDLSGEMGLKIFFLDVGQGDGAIVEVGDKRILIDAGPNSNMYNYLSKWQYKYLLDRDEKIHIDYVFISHFDLDHYKGIIPIMEDERFTFGTIYHAGILKFHKDTTYNSGLGNTIKVEAKKYLTTLFDDLTNHDETQVFNRDITNFMDALALMVEQERIQHTQRLAAGSIPIEEMIDDTEFKIELLGPISETINNEAVYAYWEDDGKTINGHSLILKITFGRRTILLGGDLNTHSENYLMEKYGDENPFEVDVAKSCHHGSSDFTEDFMAKLNPYATVISSGDNEAFSHPRADAIGCAGKYSRGSRPLVYSTELARSVDLRGNEILFGMINLRCNGSDIFISQMKESKSPSDVWDSYLLPR